MTIDELTEWFDRHHVDIIRTHATSLDGPGIGKYLHRDKFLSSLPRGHAVTDMALTMDITGTPHMTSWHHQREANLGDIYLRPDIATLVSDGTDKQLGHCICDFTNDKGEALELCPRSTLKKMVSMVEDQGYGIKTAFELEFFLFKESFEEVKRGKYKRLSPISAGGHPGIYNLRNSYLVSPYMVEVIKRLEWKGIAWEAWNDEAGLSQLELNLTPTDPVSAADNVVRAKQILYEVAVDMEMSITFMPKPSISFGSGMHIHHSLHHKDSKEPAFFDDKDANNRSKLMVKWMSGILKTMPGAVSYLCPSANSFRRFKQYAAVPMTVTWGEENKSTALRTISQSKGLARIEHRVGASDLNPYLGMSVILAGGLAGLKNDFELPQEFTQLAWGLKTSDLDLPTSLSLAAKNLKQDRFLKDIMGETTVEYWAKTREAEWLAFHTEGADALSESISAWEYERYFEQV
ncbi:MAG: glutamine synthetase [Pseudomonadales bacterium]|nr:glutamine synthetase [Pseudomonadales bacterium]